MTMARRLGAGIGWLVLILAVTGITWAVHRRVTYVVVLTAAATLMLFRFPSPVAGGGACRRQLPGCRRAVAGLAAHRSI